VKKHQVFGWTLVAMDIAVANFSRWSCGLEADKDPARQLRGVIERAFDISSRVRQFVICNRQDKRYTSDDFRTIWDRLMRRAAETRAMAERFTTSPSTISGRSP
jgi:hypothetical protein